MPVTDSYTARSTENVGFALIQNLWSGNENLCISPVSICMAMQLPLYGARGNTAVEILKVLGVNAPNREAIADDAQKLIEQLGKKPDRPTSEGPGSTLKLALANSIWTQHDVQMDEEFLSAMQTKYMAGCASLDFSDPASVDVINSWVDKQTESKIPRLIDELYPEIMVVLVNCAYFKARWKNEFNPNLTQDGPFYLSDNSAVDTPMMHSVSYRPSYFQDETIQIVQMNYTDTRFGMYVVLPARDISLSSVVSKLSAYQWQYWLSQMKEHHGSLTLPKFRIECGFDLRDNLISLGMNDAFDGRADFSAMLKERPQTFSIDAVIHKTFIDVDELGTEAAAATAIAMFGSAPSYPPKFEMVVDRPFLYAICDSETGTILFMGTVNDPRPVSRR